jgi:hypothetical protein
MVNRYRGKRVIGWAGIVRNEGVRGNGAFQRLNSLSVVALFPKQPGILDRRGSVIHLGRVKDSVKCLFGGIRFTSEACDP